MATSTKNKNSNPTQIAGPIVAELERIYSDFRKELPELPEHVVFIIAHGTTPQGSIILGHAATGRWAYKPTKRSKARAAMEVMISSECMSRGAEEVFQTLRHETVHLLATARGVQDTSRQGRWHNKRFVALAEELGMYYPVDEETGKMVPDPRIGFSAVRTTDELAKTYARRIKRLDEVMTASGISWKVKKERKPRTVVVVTPEEGEEFELGVSTYAKVQEHLKPHTAREEER